MTEYMILIYGDESSWETSTPAAQEAVYARHGAFMAGLAERGHSVVSGAELGASTGAVVVRSGAEGRPAITDGPFAEAAEQIGGFYLVESSDLDDLLLLVADLAGDDAIEVRPTVPEPS